MELDCPYCWRSHGCDLPNGHDGEHTCLTSSGKECSSCPRGHVDVFHGWTFDPEAVTEDGHS